MKKILLVLLIAIFFAHPAQARTNRSDVIQARENGWTVAWGKHIDHIEYARLAACMLDPTTACINAYFTTLLQDSAVTLGKNIVLKALKSRGNLFTEGNVQFQAGLATYNHWQNENPCSIWGDTCWYKVPLPNTHQPFVRWRSQGNTAGDSQNLPAEAPDTIASDDRESISCSVFNDGYTNISGGSDAIYSPKSNRACIPGGSTGLCRRWFGRCATTGGASVDFSVFNDGYNQIHGPSDAVYIRASNQVCTPGGSTGVCRRWFGRAKTSDNRTALCYLFNDGYTNIVGPTDAIYFRGANQFCMPDGTATGTCRRWFGRCFANK